MCGAYNKGYKFLMGETGSKSFKLMLFFNIIVNRQAIINLHLKTSRFLNNALPNAQALPSFSLNFKLKPFANALLVIAG
jgi:hypothetical protein